MMALSAFKSEHENGRVGTFIKFIWEIMGISDYILTVKEDIEL